MKKEWLMLKQVLLVISLFCCVLNVWAEADGPDFWEVHSVAANDRLNIRQQPSWQSNKLGSIPPNEQCLPNIECTGGMTFQEATTLSESEKDALRKQRPRWCKIRYQGITGWVAAKYLRESSSDQCYE
ncbi:SH3 domain-containing protein [Zooshikella marina]|uniref:SH3 domain-containing protein n=2 Tax=Zooshikella ganghwensis TaxID=202772 RepID=UPI00040138FE|nr:SH3 domain-containing protein [Zooshikella ganghwensis]MBU2709099.1 SH3 domain-containing protein [Zooshikella ganghwensis]